ncbi:Nn.00g064820.m01.CDS01 [Neocucurbitaria sp. VM-36]
MLKRTLLLASAAFVAAQSSTTDEPCAIVAARLQSSSSAVPAQEAFDCLDSVPVDTQGNSDLIDELKQVWQFQSELKWLKNPGSDWEYGALDIEAELDKVKSNLGSYSSEYTAQLAIQNITIRTGNFHFNYAPDILQVFRFRRQFNVASISSDGKSLPKLYWHDDIEAVGAGSEDVSDIKEINGQNPYDFLKSTFFSQYIDSDGQMNNMFSKGDTDNAGAFAQQRKFDGNSTDVTWTNGTSASVLNIATTQFDFSRVSDGASFFQQFCTGAISGASSSSASTKNFISRAAPGPVPRIPTGIYHRRNKRQTIPTSGTYASAVAEASSGVVAGYFLNGDGYDDIAVLKIISFSNPEPSSIDETEFNNEFQATVQSFLEQATSEKKSKLIIDLRENGGGNTNLLLDAFMQLFPDKEPFSGQRYRATDAFVKIGAAVNEIRGDASKAQQYNQFVGQDIEDGFFYRYWAWWHFRTAGGENFSGWDQFNGPLDLNSDKFTATMRYNYSSADRVSILPDGFNFVNGTRSTPFDTSNIVMYTDALCGSSCASFHEELKNIAGIKAVTVGGRPTNAPIQTVTGSKGGEVIPLIQFPSYAEVALNVTSRLSLSSVKDSDSTLNALANVPQITVRVGDSSSRAQSQDQVRKGDKTATPLQYIYEASDCKIFYTADTYADPDAAWKQAWDAFQDDSKCVEGSTKHKSSISGGYTPYGAGELKKEDQPDEPALGGDADSTNVASSKKVSSLAVTVAVVVAAMM